jgi:3-methyladenine DNA glycosylase Mpg
MLKIYSLDEGWAGGTVVVAESLEEAIKKFEEARPWRVHQRHNPLGPKKLSEDDITEHEIAPGLVVDFMGDQ